MPTRRGPSRETFTSRKLFRLPSTQSVRCPKIFQTSIPCRFDPPTLQQYRTSARSEKIPELQERENPATARCVLHGSASYEQHSQDTGYTNSQGNTHQFKSTLLQQCRTSARSEKIPELQERENPATPTWEREL